MNRAVFYCLVALASSIMDRGQAIAQDNGPQFNLAIVPPGGEPDPYGADTEYTVEVPAGSDSIHELDVILISEGITSIEGADAWALSVAFDPMSGGTMKFFDNPDPARKIPDNVSDDPKNAKHMTMGFQINSLYDHDEDPFTAPVEEVIDLAGAGYNKTFIATSDYDFPPPQIPPGLTGMVSSIVLADLMSPSIRSLRANARDTIMKLLVSIPPLEDGETKECRLFIIDRMRGPAAPVKNTISYKGEWLDPNIVQGMILRITGGSGRGSFRRGDCNADGEVNLTDVIYFLNKKFLGIGILNCRDAADVDDNGELDVSDAVRSLNYQFTGTAEAPEPPGPFSCGLDLSEDTLPPCEYPEKICR